MSCGGGFSSLMMTAGAGLMPGADAIAGIGAGLGVSPALVSNLGGFDSLGITSQFSDIVTGATGVLGSGTLDSLRTLGADVFPALTNSIPGGFASSLNVLAPGGMANGGLTGLVSSVSTGLMGGGDLTKFAQIFSSADGFASTANQIINSVSNIGSISQTFGPLTGGMDNLVSGGFSQVTEALGSFGGDLKNLGNMIDMNNLENLGNPTALVGQLAKVGGIVPGVENVLRSAGLDSGDLANLAKGSFAGITETANKSLYEGMTKITGDELAQVKAVLGVSTPGIGNMADLLNPVKILPNSFPSLTTPTPDGLRAIYATVDGAVNTNIEPVFNTSTLNLPPVSNDLVRKAREGVSILGQSRSTTSSIILT